MVELVVMIMGGWGEAGDTIVLRGCRGHGDPHSAQCQMAFKAGSRGSPRREPAHDSEKKGSSICMVTLGVLALHASPPATTASTASISSAQTEMSFLSGQPVTSTPERMMENKRDIYVHRCV
jgi:hypothetical protein